MYSYKKKKNKYSKESNNPSYKVLAAARPAALILACDLEQIYVIDIKYIYTYDINPCICA